MEGIELEVFLAIIAGAAETEAPIRGYTQTSRRYLEKIHPQLARFVGGTVQQVSELVRDEINHMTKFLGFGVWLFPESYRWRIRHMVAVAIAIKIHRFNSLQSTADLARTFGRVQEVLRWHS